MTAKFANTSKQGYPVIYRGQKAVVLFRQDAHDPYVVAHGYDEERGDWSQGILRSTRFRRNPHL